jgi:flagellar biosynthetic protein FliQ
MSEALIVGTVRQALEIAIAVSLPMLAAGLIAGVAVSLFQTVTSIQDNVLAFIPRAAAIVVVFALTFPWMLRQVSGFAAEIVRRLPEYIR